VADVIETMKLDSGITVPELKVDGGASTNDLLLQFQADLLQVPITRPKVLETTALGAAYLAGLAVGYWKDREQIESKWEAGQTLEPRLSSDEAAARRSRWSEALKRAQGWEPS